MARIGWKDVQSPDTIRGLYYEGMEAGGGTKHQLFGNFLAFSESLHYLGPEKPLGARKSPKVAKWVTLVINKRHNPVTVKIWQKMGSEIAGLSYMYTMPCTEKSGIAMKTP